MLKNTKERKDKMSVKTRLLILVLITLVGAVLGYKTEYAFFTGMF